MKNSDNEKKKEAIPTKRKQIIIIICSIALALVLCAVIIAIASPNGGGKKQLDGTFTVTVVADVEMPASYTFSEDRVTLEYFDGTETVIREFTYEIRGKAPSRTITFKGVDNNEIKTLSYSEMTDEASGDLVAIIINSVVYEKQ